MVKNALGLEHRSGVIIHQQLLSLLKQGHILGMLEGIPIRMPQLQSESKVNSGTFRGLCHHMKELLTAHALCLRLSGCYASVQFVGFARVVTHAQ